MAVVMTHTHTHTHTSPNAKESGSGWYDLFDDLHSARSAKSAAHLVRFSSPLDAGIKHLVAPCRPLLKKRLRRKSKVGLFVPNAPDDK
jgi:hypothetical protein